MRKARVFMHGKFAGVLEERTPKACSFIYASGYSGEPVSLTMPVSQPEHGFEGFPPFFEGLLPEGEMLEGLLRQCKIDRRDLFAQLLAVGADLVGAVTVAEEAS